MPSSTFFDLQRKLGKEDSKWNVVENETNIESSQKFVE